MGLRINRRKPFRLIFGVTSLVLLSWLLMQCQGLPANVANCKVTPAPPPPLTSVPPAEEPAPAAVCAFPLEISSPADGASVTSPAPIMAKATPPDSIYMMRLYVDGQAVLFSFTSSINQYIWMPNGTHLVEVVAEDNAGYVATSTIQLNVTSTSTRYQQYSEHEQLAFLLRQARIGINVRGRLGSGCVNSHARPGHPVARWVGSEIQPRWVAGLFERALLESIRGWQQREPLHPRTCIFTSTKVTLHRPWNLT